jgi:hypothetical protein
MYAGPRPPGHGAVRDGRFARMIRLLRRIRAIMGYRGFRESRIFRDPFGRAGPGRAGAGRGGAGSGQTRSAIPASAEDGDRCRRWRERSQADRGFDGEPPLHAGHFGFGIWRWGPLDGPPAADPSRSCWWCGGGWGWWCEVYAVPGPGGRDAGRGLVLVEDRAFTDDSGSHRVQKSPGEPNIPRSFSIIATGGFRVRGGAGAARVAAGGGASVPKA